MHTCSVDAFWSWWWHASIARQSFIDADTERARERDAAQACVSIARCAIMINEHARASEGAKIISL